jgi:hypothetical protein
MADDSSVAVAVTMAVVQTTQFDHERRIATLEAQWGRLLFMTVAAFCSSAASFTVLILDIVWRAKGGT